MDTQRRQRRRQTQRVGLFWTMVLQAIVIYDGIRRRARHLPRAPHRNWDIERQMTFTRMFGSTDRICRDLLRMKIGPFQSLCARLRTFGLVDSKSVRVEEQVAIFLNTVGHDQRCCRGRSTVPHIAAKVPVQDQARYRNRKQVISQNVLVACTFDMKFTYVLAGWEGSAHDVGKYYLADAGFPLVPGFLSPYRRTRYHRRDIEGQRPENRKELFNFRHSSLRNVVERTIGLLKKRFAYLRHQPFHDISTQAKIVLACCAIHNFLRIHDADDVCEEDFDNSDDEVNPTHADVPEEATINANISFTAEASWSNNRDAIAQSMWVNYNPNADADIDFH
ncbi:putative harbinger transposase-derived nuclease [Abeliophyllum distichum]|uniref:Harbinger transposase-derived nuclease n=1 Tax=Abeliophyllum distichum TaxID=126358 RepID=A0ABD1UH73_9LAMI